MSEPQWAPRAEKRRVWPWVLLGFAVAIVLGVVAIAAMVFNEADEESDRKIRVTYEVTGDAKDASITYTTWNNGNTSSSSVSDVRLPWRKEVESTGLMKGGSLVVTLGESGGTATCSVTVDDNPPQTSTARGKFATATCDG
ncbi:MmpS family transport accessory protein [Streptomyces spiramyceticus]|uniref:MmpS family transport accessory protein n=1 Tax=Streptomyces spiramyceticus TaxID=299717 RepID=UPI00237AACFF|nr:MmpS family transport accessory protein [Streptomyces spiramyceticus]